MKKNQSQKIKFMLRFEKLNLRFEHMPLWAQHGVGQEK